MQCKWDDPRELRLFERKLGQYEVAGAIFSHGDAIDFIDGKKKGVIIADTCGSDETFGNQAASFLRRSIEDGWGASHDARTETYDLGRRLAEAGPGLDHWEGMDFSTKCWWGSIEFKYLHLDAEVSLVGLKFFVLYKKGSFEVLDSIDIDPYDFHRDEKKDALPNVIDDFSVLLMASDGLEVNIRRGVSPGNVTGQGEPEDKRDSNTQIAAFLQKYQKENATHLRDQFLAEVGTLFLPYQSRRTSYDDVTFAFIRKL